jgi:hypothetical protein
MFWKLYFLIYLLLTLLSLYSVFTKQPSLAPLGIFSIIVSLFLLLSIFSYTFKKIYINRTFWRIVLFIALADFIMYNLSLFIIPNGYSLYTPSENPPGMVEHIFDTIMDLPAYYAIVKLATESQFSSSTSIPEVVK